MLKNKEKPIKTDIFSPTKQSQKHGNSDYLDLWKPNQFRFTKGRKNGRSLPAEIPLKEVSGMDNNNLFFKNKSVVLKEKRRMTIQNDTRQHKKKSRKSYDEDPLNMKVDAGEVSSIMDEYPSSVIKEYLTCDKCHLLMKNRVTHECYPHICPQCPDKVTFKNSYHLDHHTKNVHNASNNANLSGDSIGFQINKYSCPLCKMDFNNIIDLGRHKSSCSGNAKCIDCGVPINLKGSNHYCKKCSIAKKKEVKDKIQKKPAAAENKINKVEKKIIHKKNSLKSGKKVVIPLKFNHKKSYSKLHNSSLKNEISTKKPKHCSSSPKESEFSEPAIAVDRYQRKIQYRCYQCNFCCVSPYSFELHKGEQCFQRIKHMANCKVSLKRDPVLLGKHGFTIYGKRIKEEYVDRNVPSHATTSIRRDNPKYSCSQCGRSFYDCDTYERHIITDHCERITCPSCKVSFSQTIFYDMHDCQGKHRKKSKRSQANLTCHNRDSSDSCILSPELLSNSNVDELEAHINNQNSAAEVYPEPLSVLPEFDTQHEFEKDCGIVQTSLLHDAASALPPTVNSSTETLIQVFEHIPSASSNGSKNHRKCDNFHCTNDLNKIYDLRTSLQYSYLANFSDELSGSYYLQHSTTASMEKVFRCDTYSPPQIISRDISLSPQSDMLNLSADSFLGDKDMVASRVKSTLYPGDKATNVSSNEPEDGNRLEKPFPVPVISDVVSFASLRKAQENAAVHGFTMEAGDSVQYICSKCFLSVQSPEEFPKHFLDKHNIRIEKANLYWK